MSSFALSLQGYQEYKSKKHLKTPGEKVTLPIPRALNILPFDAAK